MIKGKRDILTKQKLPTWNTLVWVTLALPSHVQWGHHAFAVVIIDLWRYCECIHLRCVCLFHSIGNDTSVPLEVERTIRRHLNSWSKVLQFQVFRSWTPCRIASKNTKKESDSLHTWDFYMLSIFTAGFIPNIVHFKYILGQVKIFTARLTHRMIKFSSEKHSFISYNIPGVTGHNMNTLNHIMSLSHGSKNYNEFCELASTFWIWTLVSPPFLSFFIIPDSISTRDLNLIEQCFKYDVSQLIIQNQA